MPAVRLRAALRASLRPALAVAFLLGPTLTASAMLWCRLGATLADCGVDRQAPLFGDEVHYRTEAECWSRAGFGGGYFCADERPAAAAWSHFGPHGPGFPVVLGTLAPLAGWHAAAGPFVNAALSALASAVWLWRCRPPTPQLAAATLLMLTFWPAVLFLPSTMQEGFHAAAAVALAGLIGPALNRGDARPRVLACILAAIALAAAVRVTWALVLLALACATLPRASGRVRWLGWPLVLAATAALFAGWRWVTAPYPNYLSSLAGSIAAYPRAGLLSFLLHAGRQFAGYLTLGWGPAAALRYEVVGLVAGLTVALCAFMPAGIKLESRPRTALWRSGPILAALAGLLIAWPRTAAVEWLTAGQVNLRLALCGCLVFLVSLLVAVNRGTVRAALARAGENPAAAFGLANVFIPLALTVALYNASGWHDYRVLAPHLLLSLLVLAAGPGWRWAFVAGVVNLVMLPAVLPTFDSFHRARVAQTRAGPAVDLSPWLTFRPGAPPWENTLLIADVAGGPFPVVPAGNGVSFLVRGVSKPPRSRHVLLRERSAQWEGVRLEKVAETPAGVLYRKLDTRHKPGFW